MRQGRWKLVAKGPAGKWELYDMQADRSETADVAARNPLVVKDLSSRWEAWAKRAHVLPWVWEPPYGAGASGSAEKR